MLEGLFSTLNPAVPPVPSLKNQREPLELLNLLAVPLVPPVPREKTKTKAENTSPIEPDPTTDPLLVEVWTPSGTQMTTRADNAEHAEWLRQKNPRPVNSTPEPTTPEPESDRISEAEHNAAGRFFKWLITRPDDTQFYSCSMLRMTNSEVREQYPDATDIQPIENEDYPND